MSVIITDQASTIEFLFSTGERKVLDKDNLNIKEENNVFSKWVYITNAPGFVQTAQNDVIKLKYSEVTSPALVSNQELIDLILLYKASSGYTIGNVVITDGVRTLKIEPNGSMPVTIQDQTTPVIIVPFSKLEESTLTVGNMAIDDYQLTVASPTGISTGKLLTLFDPTSVRFTTFKVVTIASSLVTLDRPSDFAYPNGSYVDVSDVHMNVDGSGTPVVFGLRNNAGATPPPGINLSMDVTRILFSCETTNVPELDMFGDIIGGLTRGLFARRRNESTHNIFNIKTNGEMDGIMYDWKEFDAAKRGVNGFSGRLTFGGQSKMGAVVRLEIDEDFELFVQDNLTTILDLTVMAEGSIVEP